MNSIIYNFSNRVFLITGGTSGIGKDLAIFIVNNGGKVVLTYRSELKLNSMQLLLNDKLLFALNIDLENIESIESSFHLLKKQNIKFDGYIHCAGTAEPRPLNMMNAKYYNKVFNLNVFSFFEISKLLIKNSLLHNPSSIIAISSIASRFGDKGKILYSASKGALDSSIKSMAKELAPKGVRVNTVLPGFIKTEMYLDYENIIGKDKINNMISNYQYLGLGSTSDVIYSIAFLLSEQSSFITGTNLVVDGGWLS
jgi:NAD(P)-dependent dehydrogenase (short-subunit alcohol dehydrogenase family)